jgi:hypothetical protein
MVVPPSQANDACAARTSAWTIIFHDSLYFKLDPDSPQLTKTHVQAAYGIPPFNIRNVFPFACHQFNQSSTSACNSTMLHICTGPMPWVSKGATFMALCSLPHFSITFPKIHPINAELSHTLDLCCSPVASSHICRLAKCCTIHALVTSLVPKRTKMFQVVNCSNTSAFIQYFGPRALLRVPRLIIGNFEISRQES